MSKNLGSHHKIYAPNLLDADSKKKLDEGKEVQITISARVQNYSLYTSIKFGDHLFGMISDKKQSKLLGKKGITELAYKYTIRPDERKKFKQNDGGKKQ